MQTHGILVLTFTVACQVAALATNATTLSSTNISAPQDVTFEQCRANCTLRNFAGVTIVWTKMSVSATFTAATVVTVINTVLHITKVKTIYADLPSGVQLPPTGTNGRRIVVMTNSPIIGLDPQCTSEAFYCTTDGPEQVTTLTYPDNIYDIHRGHLFQGTLPTTDSTGKSTCLVASTTTFVSFPTLTPSLPPQPIDEDDPLGYLWYTGIDLIGSWSTVFPDHAALRLCNPGMSSAGPATMRAALFLTRTKTQFDDHLTAESATLDTGATTTPSKDASVVPRVSTVSPRRTAATATIIAGPTTADAVGSGAQEPASTHSPTPAPSPATPHTQVQSTPSRFVSENLWPMSERSKAPGDTDPRIVSTSRAVQALVGNVPDINWQGIQSHDQTPSTASTPSRSYTSSKTGVMPSHQAESSGVTGSTDDSTGGSLRKPGIVEVAGLAFTPASSSSYVAPNGQTFGPGQTVYVGTADSPTPVVLTTDRGGSAVFIVGSSTVPVPSLQTLDIGGNIFAGLGGTPSPSSSTPDSDFEDQVDAAPGEGSIEETTESRPAPGTIVVGMASGAPNLIVPTGSSRTASVTPFTGAATALKVSCWLLVSTLLVVATL